MWGRQGWKLEIRSQGDVGTGGRITQSDQCRLIIRNNANALSTLQPNEGQEQPNASRHRQ